MTAPAAPAAPSPRQHIPRYTAMAVLAGQRERGVFTLTPDLAPAPSNLKKRKKSLAAPSLLERRARQLGVEVLLKALAEGASPERAVRRSWEMYGVNQRGKLSPHEWLALLQGNAS